MRHPSTKVSRTYQLEEKLSICLHVGQQVLEGNFRRTTHRSLAIVCRYFIPRCYTAQIGPCYMQNSLQSIGPVSDKCLEVFLDL